MKGIWSIVLAFLLVLATGEAGAEITDIHSAINKAGRQRMLSQRMAKYYQALVWGVGDAASAAELEKSRREFDGAQQELAAAGAKAPRIREGLELVQQQWIFFQSALDPRNVRDKRSALMVASASERILEEMENLVGLYEKGASR